MAFTCNIDRRGRMIRTIAGAAVLLAGLSLLAAALLGSGGEVEAAGAVATPEASDRRLALLIGGIAAAGGGAFMLFEGLAGWCAVRAMGFRTPV